MASSSNNVSHYQLNAKNNEQLQFKDYDALIPSDLAKWTSKGKTTIEGQVESIKSQEKLINSFSHKVEEFH